MTCTVSSAIDSVTVSRAAARLGVTFLGCSAWASAMASTASSSVIGSNSWATRDTMVETTNAPASRAMSSSVVPPTRTPI